MITLIIVTTVRNFYHLFKEIIQYFSMEGKYGNTFVGQLNKIKH